MARMIYSIIYIYYPTFNLTEYQHQQQQDNNNNNTKINNNNIQYIIVMNKARNQKKDLTRTLKAMKIQQSAYRHNELSKDLYHQYSNSIQTKPYDQKLVYTSVNRKNQMSRGTKKRKYRYDNKYNIQAGDNIVGLGFRQQRSLDVKKENFFKISQRYDQPESKNPYLTRNKITSVTKQLRRSSNQPRRLTTQQSTQPQPIRKNFHFKTLQSTSQPLHKASLIEQAKTLSTNGSIAESQLIIQRILRQDPQNKQALYISGCNNFNQMNYLRCITAFNFLLEIDPVYNKNAYIMTSICYSNKGQKEEAMLRVNTCLMHFPDFYQAHFQKAKLWIKEGDLENAVKSLKRALKLAKEPYQCCIKLGECYQKQQMYQLALKLYQKVSNHPTKTKNDTHQKSLFLIKKSQCQKKLQKFPSLISTLQSYLQLIDRNTVINISKIQLEIGYSYYRIGDYANAIMNLEEVFLEKNRKESTEALILLTVIYIKRRDFYQAYHCLVRKEHLDVNTADLEFYEKFCQGVLSLMKRKFDVGLEKLIQIQSQIGEICKDQFHKEIAIIYPMYLSYAYFCFGRTDKCLKIYKKLLQQKTPELSLHVKGIQFNLALCQGIQQYKHKKLPSARQHFQKSTQIYPNKPQGFLYLAITLIQLYLKDYNESLLKRAKSILATCINNLKELNNNYSASVFYVKAVLSASMGDWDNAINQIDQSIQRAEDNQAKSFYLRALILACCQNYKQAVGQAGIAISLNSKEPAYYLLRSKCQQIEGDGNRAFMDLQEYIALCPDDSQIHKFAGHLLFQNGAFEDALQAYDNGQITVDASNYDVFLTRAKTYFLLGQFDKSAADMETANTLRPGDGPSISFDICVIKILHEFFQERQSDKLCIERAEKAKQELENLAAVGEDIDYGRIFKKIQICMLVAMFLFYMGKYKQSARQFKQTLTLKQVNLTTNDSEFEQQVKQKQFFIAQMQYNRAVCYLMLSEHLAAIKVLESCKVQPGSKTQGRLEDLVGILKGKKEGKLESFQVFSQKNKMSRVLNDVTIKCHNNDFVKLKLSIPFPKVQPPEISPKFQIRILRQIDIESIQKKPEAPWILREQNSIKFTQKIQQFSRLQINNSQISKVQKYQKPMGDNFCDLDQQRSEGENSYESFSDLKEKLKLDDKVQNKLNKILRRGAN